MARENCFQDEVVVVIGGGSGIGLTAAKQFQQGGAEIVIAGRSGARLSAALDELALNTGDHPARAVVCDIANAESLEGLVKELSQGPPVRALVLAAGLSPGMADSRELIEVDLIGACRALEAVLPVMSPGGAAVVLSSVAGHFVPADPAVVELMADPLAEDLQERLAALPGEPCANPILAYSHAKRAVRAMVERLAPKWGARGVRLVCLSPGMIATEMGKREQEDQPLMGALLGNAPIPRLGRSEEAAGIAVFLCSDAASYVTGCDWLVDGGVTSATLATGYRSEDESA